MGALNIRFLPDTIRSIDSATFTGSYQAVGSVLTFPTRVVKFTNNSTVLVTISWDGTSDHEVLPAGSFMLIDVSANHEAVENRCDIAAKTQFYVKASAGTGLLYISTYYTA